MDTQHVPELTKRDLQRILAREFPDSGMSEAEALLSGYGTEPGHCERTRVLIAAMKLAGGNLRSLADAVAMAVVDYRDVLAYAEYPSYAGLPHDAPDDRRRAARADDWRQYQHWLRR